MKRRPGAEIAEKARVVTVVDVAHRHDAYRT